MKLSTAGSVSMTNVNAYPLTASPTLTNPDMILPYNDEDISISTSSWTSNGNGFGHNTNDNHFSSVVSLTTPRAPIVYGTGTILSDIGEVTEAEGTPNGQKSEITEKKFTRQPQYHMPVRSSSKNAHETLRKRAKVESHRRHMSNELTSTVASDEACNHFFKDIDGDLTFDDISFQGDDEESAVDTDSDDTTSSEVCRSWKERVKFGLNDDSSSALSRRAEKILFNAKMRLNAMEGNLNRARTSIIEWQDSCNVSMENTSPFICSKPPAHQNDPSMPHRIFSTIDRHWEVQSEPACDELVRYKRNYEKQQLESSPAVDVPVRFREKRDSLLSDYSIEYSDEKFLSKSGSNLPATKTPSSGSTSKSHKFHDISQLNYNQRLNDQTSEDDLNQLGEVRTLTRSASSFQMREIQDQVEDLRGRLSSLRERTKNDVVRRRSLQSLKIPTPFTFAEKHCFEDKTYFISEPLNVESNMARSNSVSDNDSVMDSRILDPKLHDSFPEKDSSKELNTGLASDYEPNIITLKAEIENKIDVKLISKEETEDAEDNVSESGVSVYYDTIVSHEDREDAFDYENFFLHSAMGTIGQQRRDSFSSEESVETTRGYSTFIHNEHSSVDGLSTHLRSPSTDTLSTVASFETAVEGLEIEDKLQDKLDSFAVQSNNVNTSKNYSCIGDRNISRKPSIVSFEQSGAKTRFSISSDIPKRRLIKARFVIQDISVEPSDAHQSDANLILDSKSSNTEYNQPAADNHSSLTSTPMDQLSKDDQTLVKRLVNSLGECVLSLQDTENSYDARVWRRRLDAARRVLEGFEGAV